MYALAFYDCHTERLLLARDPWGMKPLFYAENDKYLVVSSEIREHAGIRAWCPKNRNWGR
jgi:asparagine synthase (glutamine-hydrolysing)